MRIAPLTTLPPRDDRLAATQGSDRRGTKDCISIASTNASSNATHANTNTTTTHIRAQGHQRSASCNGNTNNARAKPLGPVSDLVYAATFRLGWRRHRDLPLADGSQHHQQCDGDATLCRGASNTQGPSDEQTIRPSHGGLGTVGDAGRNPDRVEAVCLVRRIVRLWCVVICLRVSE